MKHFTLAYFGSSSFSAYLLEKLLTDKTLPIELVCVVTQPDKPFGRKHILTACPVKHTAKEYGLPIMEEITPHLSSIDLALVYAYGKIIPASLLQQAKLGFFNLHPSLLPHLRGPSPIPYSIIFNDVESGASIIKMDEKIDHGKLILQKKIMILPTDTKSDLEIKFTDLGFTLFKKMFLAIVQTPTTEIKMTEQHHEKTTYTRLLTKNDGFISFQTVQRALRGEILTHEDLPQIIKEYLMKYPNETEGFFKRTSHVSLLLYNLFRGLSPWPGIWTTITLNRQEKRLKILDVTYKEKKLSIAKVQLEGKKPVDFETFNKTYSLI